MVSILLWVAGDETNGVLWTIVVWAMMCLDVDDACVVKREDGNVLPE